MIGTAKHEGEALLGGSKRYKRNM